ncbi:MFS transporter [Thiovibrio sp. JS02]
MKLSHAIPAEKRLIFAWCLYDWANSAFTTLVVTFVYAAYYIRNMAADPTAGTTLWARGITISALLVALLSPFLGAAADRLGKRRAYLIRASLLCMVATALLTFVSPELPNAATWALALFIIANVAFELGIVFYNAMLPAVTTPDKLGAVSGYGWGFGYLGGLFCLCLAGLTLVTDTPIWPVPTEAGFQYRASNLLVALWFLLFSLPLFRLVPRESPAGANDAPVCRHSALRQTCKDLHRYPKVRKFLLAHLLYNDGLVTIIAFGGIYAAGTFQMRFSEVLVFGIALNIAAGLGALLMGRLDDRLGGRTVILISLVALAAGSLLAVLTRDRFMFWIAGCVIGFFTGPNQSASRSLMARLTPERHRAEFFGFFTLSGKITSFLGPLLLGWATTYWQSQRAGMATVLLFFAAGALLLLRVPGKGRQSAAAA